MTKNDDSGANDRPYDQAVNPDDFYIKEFDTLRKEVEWTLNDSRMVERNVIIVIGAFWAFLIKESGNIGKFAHPALAWWIPVLFSVLGALRSAALGFKFLCLGKYIRKLENYFLRETAKRPEGWENFQVTVGGFVRVSACAFWLILIAVTVVIAVFETSISHK